MSAEPDVGNDEEAVEAARQTTSMQDQLSQEVTSWSKARRQRSSETVAVPDHPGTPRRSPQSTGAARKSSAPPPASKPTGTSSKPFKMSYDGMTQAEYTQYLRDQGSR
jgi:hypothetical protein